MRVDAHQHFWDFNPIRDAWISDDMGVIKKNFTPSDLKPLLDRHDIDTCVAVQADQSEDETSFLLGLANQNTWIKGVVGWINILGPDLKDRLDYFSENKSFKGIRHIVQAESEGFMISQKFCEGLKTLAETGLTYDLLITEDQLGEAIQLIQSLPEMKIVIDHIAKPDIKSESFDNWAKYMDTIAKHENIYVKLSGMVTEADWKDWSTNDLLPYVDFCLEKFGPKRLMYGSDWPVCLLAGSYSEVYNALKQLISQLSPAEQESIYGKTAVEFYNLN